MPYYRYLKLFRVRQEGGALSGNVTTESESASSESSIIKQVTYRGITYTRELSEIMPLSLSTPKIEETDYAPIHVATFYFPKNAMGNYSFGDITITPTQGTAPTMETRITEGENGNVTLELSVEDVGKYTGTITIPVTSTGLALENGVLAQRQLSETFYVEYALEYLAAKVGVLFNFRETDTGGYATKTEQIVDYALLGRGFQVTKEYYENGIPGDQTFISAMSDFRENDSEVVILLGNGYPQEMVEQMFNGYWEYPTCLIFYLSDYPQFDFENTNPSFESAVLSNGRVEGAYSFAEWLVQSSKRMRDKFIFVGKIITGVTGDTQSSALNAFSASAYTTRDTQYDSLNTMQDPTDTQGAENFIEALISAGIDATEYMLITNNNDVTFAVADKLRELGYNEYSGDIGSGSYFCLYCLDNAYFADGDVSDYVNNKGVTGWLYGSPSNTILRDLITAHFTEGMTAYLNNNYSPDSEGRYSVFWWEHYFNSDSNE